MSANHPALPDAQIMAGVLLCGSDWVTSFVSHLQKQDCVQTLNFLPSAHRMDSERIVRKYLTKRRLLDYNRLPTFFFSFFLFSFLFEHPSYPYHPSVLF